MGYSCLAIDSMVTDELIAILQEANGNPSNSSNTWGNSFFQQGQENRDGAVTGSVWTAIPGMENRCRKVGGVRVYDGKVIRWPGSTKAQRELAEKRGAEKAKRYGKLEISSW